MKNIVLIGFMASGKTTIARKLAKATNRLFIDTDHLIEQNEDMRISEIFEKFGEKHFRELEKKAALWIENSLTNAVISTGGGMPLACDNLKKIGKVVYLDASFELITKRLSNQEEQNKRPLAFDLKELYDRYQKRDPIYRAISDQIVTADKSIEAIAQEIIG